ncbi:Cation-dependent mannose-6-phosphate receptor [Mizuhopecten yessoensis]|uniref:Autophagy-related protein 27 n=2 Tax=Mizuhopecten yessoensis TaxID=6573 RepID=A0A210R056_MIZYE|nr:Cation-dependent mannose-6-phosphate receptor [Mizuhopecten yessoensis]
MVETGFVSAKDCVGTGSCSCQFTDGTTIDLTPLSSKDVNNPTFMDISGPTPLDIYSWNPCADFTEGPDGCTNVAVCNIHQNIPNAAYFSLGTTDSVTFTTDDLGQVTMNYQFTGTGTPIVQRNSHILLTCDQSQEGTLVAQGPLPDPSSPDYYFGLQSKYVCPGNSPGGGGKSSAMSVGSILCIAVLVIALVYVIGGMSINVFYRKHIGIERFPNASFWLLVPGLIKDGCKFVITRGKTTTYDRI